MDTTIIYSQFELLVKLKGIVTRILVFLLAIFLCLMVTFLRWNNWPSLNNESLWKLPELVIRAICKSLQCYIDVGTLFTVSRFFTFLLPISSQIFLLYLPTRIFEISRQTERPTAGTDFKTDSVLKDVRLIFLTLQAPTSQTGQTRSNNSSAIA